MPTPPKIYADANDQTEDGEYLLVFDRSRQDIERIGSPLVAGMRITLNVQDELEMEADLAYNTEWKSWVGRPDFSTIKYLT